MPNNSGVRCLTHNIRFTMAAGSDERQLTMPAMGLDMPITNPPLGCVLMRAVEEPEAGTYGGCVIAEGAQ